MNISRLKEIIKYCVDDQEVDVIESLFSKTVVEHDPIMGIDFEPMDVVFKAKRMIENFFHYHGIGQCVIS